MLIMIPAKIATPKFFTQSELYSQLVAIITSALTTSMNSPRLKTIAGKEKITKIGLIAMLTSASIKPAKSTVTQLPLPSLRWSEPKIP